MVREGERTRKLGNVLERRPSGPPSTVLLEELLPISDGSPTTVPARLDLVSSSLFKQATVDVERHVPLSLTLSARCSKLHLLS